MKIATLKIAASGLMLTVLLTGCGGGGGGGTVETATPTFDYTKLNRTYRCTAVATGVVEQFTGTFTASNLKVVVSPSGNTKDVNDVIGFSNGYPRYSSKIAGTDEAVTFFFFTDGALGYGRGKVSGIESLVFNSLQTSICAKI